MTTDRKAIETETGNRSQSPLLPFAEAELLSVRLLPSEFARAVGVSKQSVSRWIKEAKVTLGADGRMNPNQAMAQLLRNVDPGRIRARLLKQAVTDVADLRAEAARADELSQKVAVLSEQIEAERFEADTDYEIVEGWLEEFKRRIVEMPKHQRAGLDADAWRALVNATLLVVMNSQDMGEIDEMVSLELQDLGEFQAPAQPLEGDGDG